MTIYNGEKYLVEQLDSIKNQSIVVDEVIICDDVSSDNSVNIVKEYIVSNGLEDTWHLYENEKNLGYADNFYKAMKLCKGEYIFLADQDDIWDSNRIEMMVDVMDENPNIKLMGSEFTPFYCTEDAPKITSKQLKSMNNNGDLEHIKLDNKTIFIGCEGCTMVVRKDFLEEIGKYWHDGWAHDEFIWKMALCYNGCYVYHKSTLDRRLHSNNASKNKLHDYNNRVNFLKELQKSHEGMLVCAKDLKLDEKYINLINKNIDSVKLRVDLLDNKKYMNTIPLTLFYSNNYHSRKSIPVELLMAIRNK